MEGEGGGVSLGREGALHLHPCTEQEDVVLGGIQSPRSSTLRCHLYGVPKVIKSTETGWWLQNGMETEVQRRGQCSVGTVAVGEGGSREGCPCLYGVNVLDARGLHL